MCLVNISHQLHTKRMCRVTDQSLFLSNSNTFVWCTTPTLSFLFLYCVADPPRITSHSKESKDAVPDTPTSLNTAVQKTKESEVSKTLHLNIVCTHYTMVDPGRFPWLHEITFDRRIHSLPSEVRVSIQADTCNVITSKCRIVNLKIEASFCSMRKRLHAKHWSPI